MTSTAPIEIASAWLPHSRFRAEEFPVGQTGRSFELESGVHWDGAPVENAFLILRMAGGRAFARLRVIVGAGGLPWAECEAVT
ncbi:MAG: hypothetical protein JO247_20595 [Chloroflexi bacterium]|nr:hypothetical protein [Chloroflexota bacterium]